MQFFIIIGIALYFLFVTKYPFKKNKCYECIALIKKLALENTTLTLFSIDYVIAKKIKGELKGTDRAEIIRERNQSNLIVSCIFMACSFLVILCEIDVLTYIFLGFNGYRFISRSLEIIVSFSFDCFNEEENKSEIEKAERIKLAIKSYFEICIYSASFYVMIIKSSGGSLILKSLLMSLSVGTLTNVGYITETSLLPFEGLQLLPFLQVFATLSLVVLSFTMYISRKS